MGNSVIPRLQQRSPKLTAGNKFARRRMAPPNRSRTGGVQEPITSGFKPSSLSNERRAKKSSLHRGPGKHWLSKPAIIYRGEREICNPSTPEGRAEYKWRTLLMWVRQDGWCCFHEYEFCPGRLKLSQATFEHEGKRTRARQDDRIAICEDGHFVRHLNGAAHGECNGIAGSRMLPIWHGDKAIVEELTSGNGAEK